MALGAAAASGGDGCARAREGEKAEEGNEGEGEREGVQGVEEECVATPRATGRRGGEAGRVVAWRARRRRGVPPLPTGTRRKATGRRRWWAGPEQELGRLGCQVSAR